MVDWLSLWWIDRYRELEIELAGVLEVGRLFEVLVGLVDLKFEVEQVGQTLVVLDLLVDRLQEEYW